MPQNSKPKKKKSMDILLRNQLIGGIFAAVIVTFAAIRIFVLHASIDGILMNLMSIMGAMLSVIVLTSAVSIMLSSKKAKSFKEILIEGCLDVDRRYGALIIGKQGAEVAAGNVDGMTYLIADNVDTVYTSSPDEWKGVHYFEKFKFSEDFLQTGMIYYYVNYANMGTRANRLGDTPETVARLLARDTAVAIQRSFSDILNAHALEVTQEEGRAVVSILITSSKTARDAERIIELLNYMLFLHFVAT